MEHLHTGVSESAVFLAERVNDCPQVGIILGSGLGGIGDAVDLQAAIDYHEIPYFFRSTAIGHNGRFLFGRVGGKPVVAMQGRLHLYEGYSAEEATFPVRFMQALGIKLLIVSNAAGGLKMLVRLGDRVEQGQPLVRVFAKPNAFARVREELLAAIVIEDAAVQPPQLIVERIT